MPSTFDYNKAKLDGSAELFCGKTVTKKFSKHTGKYLQPEIKYVILINSCVNI